MNSKISAVPVTYMLWDFVVRKQPSLFGTFSSHSTDADRWIPNLNGTLCVLMSAVSMFFSLSNSRISKLQVFHKAPESNKGRNGELVHIRQIPVIVILTIMAVLNDIAVHVYLDLDRCEANNEHYLEKRFKVLCDRMRCITEGIQLG